VFILGARRRRKLHVEKQAAQAALGLLVGAMIVATGFVAHAALPGAAYTVASGKLTGLGVTVPGPNSHAGTHPDARGNSATGQPTSPDSQGKGSEISALATTTTATGMAKGALISATASGGNSQAGTHSGASVSTPNTGGTGTADTKSGGHSSTGTAKANTASGTRSAAGSGNASAHRP
jgi:hypothetical protein